MVNIFTLPFIIYILIPKKSLFQGLINKYAMHGELKKY